MNGEELRDYVRFRVADHGLDNYVNGQRALRRYCQAAKFPWLKDIAGALIKFQSGKAEYLLGETGLRALQQVWVQDGDTGEWTLLDPLEDREFEAAVREATDDNGTTDDTPPTGYRLYGPDGLTLQIVPTPAQDYEGRISGIANTPVIDRMAELPGPSDYHELIGDLWVGLELQHQALTMLKSAGTEMQLSTALQLKIAGQQMESTALAAMQKVVSDAFGQQRDSLQAPKQRLMR